jgi:DNA-binding transcriptional ArsR family regulator
VNPAALALVSAPDTAAFLLEPTRRRLLAELAEPASAAGLARRLALPRQRLNYHLRALERAGFVECVAERRRRNCTERLLCATARAVVLQPEALGAAGTDLGAAADRTSAAYLVALASRAARETAALAERAPSERKRLATLALDAEVRFASAERRAAFAEELAAAVARLAARYDEPGARGARAFRLAVLVHPQPAAPAPAGPPPDTRAVPHRPRRKR